MQHRHADPAKWEYTVDRLTDTVEGALQKIGFTGPMGLYKQDYGGSIGNRLIGPHPDWLSWQTIQNANCYAEGFTGVWDGIRTSCGPTGAPRLRTPATAQ